MGVLASPGPREPTALTVIPTTLLGKRDRGHYGDQGASPWLREPERPGGLRLPTQPARAPSPRLSRARTTPQRNPRGLQGLRVQSGTSPSWRGRGLKSPGPRLCLAFLQAGDPFPRLGVEKRTGQDEGGAQTRFSARSQRGEQHAAELRTRAERPPLSLPAPLPAPRRNGRWPECACATRGGKRWRGREPIYCERGPPPAGPRAPAPLSHSHGRAPRPRPGRRAHAPGR